MTKFFKGKSKKKVETPVPREYKVLEAEYAKLAGQAGQLQYQLYVNETALEQLNRQIESVNQEAAVRKQLDQAAQTQTTDTAPASGAV